MIPRNVPLVTSGPKASQNQLAHTTGKPSARLPRNRPTEHEPDTKPAKSERGRELRCYGARRGTFSRLHICRRGEGAFSPESPVCSSQTLTRRSQEFQRQGWFKPSHFDGLAIMLFPDETVKRNNQADNIRRLGKASNDAGK